MHIRMACVAVAALLALPLATPSFAADKGPGNFAQDKAAIVATGVNQGPSVYVPIVSPSYGFAVNCADKVVSIAKTDVVVDHYSLALNVRDRMKKQGAAVQPFEASLIGDSPGSLNAPVTGDNGSAHTARSLAKDMDFVTDDGKIVTGVQLAAAWDAALADLRMRGPQTQ